MFNEGKLETEHLSHEYSVNQDGKSIFISIRAVLVVGGGAGGCDYMDSSVQVVVF